MYGVLLIGHLSWSHESTKLDILRIAMCCMQLKGLDQVLFGPEFGRLKNVCEGDIGGC